MRIRFVDSCLVAITINFQLISNKSNRSKGILYDKGQILVRLKAHKMFLPWFSFAEII